MSVIIAIKDKDYVHLIADSQTSVGDMKYMMPNETNFKIFKPKGLNGCLIGKSGSVRDKALIKTIDFELENNGEITYEVIVRNIVPKILEVSEEFGKKYNLEKENINSSYILAFKDKIYLKNNINGDKMTLSDALKQIFNNKIPNIKAEAIVREKSLLISIIKDLVPNNKNSKTYIALITHYNFVETFYYSNNLDLDYSIVYSELKELFSEQVIKKHLSVTLTSLGKAVPKNATKEKTKSKDASSNVRQEVIKPPQKGSTQVKRNVTPIHNVITPPPPPSGVKKNAVATSNINNEKTQFEAIKKERIKNAGTYRSRKNTKSLEIIEQIIQRRKIEISQIQEFLKRYNVSDNRRKTLENYIKISSDEKRIMEELKASLNKPASNSKKQVPVQKTVKPKNSLPALSRSAAYKKLNASIDKNLGSFISRVERDKSKLRYKIISYNYYSAFEYFLNSQNNRIKLQSVFNYVVHLEKNYKYVYWDHLNNRTFGLVQYVINNQSYFTDLKIK